MNDPGSLGALLPIGIDMTHHIMTDLGLPGLGHIIIDILSMCLQLIDLLLSNTRTSILLFQSKLHLRLGQSDPQSSPGPKLHIR